MAQGMVAANREGLAMHPDPEPNGAPLRFKIELVAENIESASRRLTDLAQILNPHGAYVGDIDGFANADPAPATPTQSANEKLIAKVRAAYKDACSTPIGSDVYELAKTELALSTKFLINALEAETKEKERLATENAELRKDKERLKALEANCWGLIPVDEPTGGDDTEIVWQVVEYHMAKPYERQLGYGRTPREAIDAAKSRALTKG